MLTTFDDKIDWKTNKMRPGKQLWKVSSFVGLFVMNFIKFHFR